MTTEHYIPVCLLVFISLLTGCGNSNTDKNSDSRFIIELGSDLEGTTYSIIDTVADSLIYDSGHDEIRLDTVIDGCHIYYEDFYDQEFAGRYVIYNPDDSLLLCATHCWGCDLNAEDWEKLNSWNKKRLHVQSLDLENRKITVTVFNGDVTTLELRGERHGNYWVEYNVVRNNIVAYTQVLEPGDTLVEMNTDVHLLVYYKGKFLTERVLNSFSFTGIPDPEIYILASTDKVWFEVVDNTLIGNAPMCMAESDCGFHTWTKIDSTGNISLIYADVILGDEPYETFVHTMRYEYKITETEISREEFFEAYEHRFEHNQIRDTTLNSDIRKRIEVAVLRTLADEEKEAYGWEDYEIHNIGRFPSGEYIADLDYAFWQGAVFIDKDFQVDTTVIEAADYGVYSNDGIYVGCESFDCDSHARLHFYTHRGEADAQMKKVAIHINGNWYFPWDETVPEFEGLDLKMPMFWHNGAVYCAGVRYRDETGTWIAKPIFLKLELKKTVGVEYHEKMMHHHFTNL